jgi:hypothetical protein
MQRALLKVLTVILTVPEWLKVLVTGASALDATVQDDDEWVDTSGARSAFVQIEPLLVSNCKIQIQGADEAKGEWSTLKEYSTPSAEAEYLHLLGDVPFASSTRLYRFLRWRLECTTPSTYEAIFRVVMTLKK